MLGLSKWAMGNAVAFLSTVVSGIPVPQRGTTLSTRRICFVHRDYRDVSLKPYLVLAFRVEGISVRQSALLPASVYTKHPKSQANHQSAAIRRPGISSV